MNNCILSILNNSDRLSALDVQKAYPMFTQNIILMFIIMVHILWFKNPLSTRSDFITCGKIGRRTEQVFLGKFHKLWAEKKINWLQFFLVSEKIPTSYIYFRPQYDLLFSFFKFSTLHFFSPMLGQICFSKVYSMSGCATVCSSWRTFD